MCYNLPKHLGKFSSPGRLLGVFSFWKEKVHYYPQSLTGHQSIFFPHYPPKKSWTRSIPSNYFCWSNLPQVSSKMLPQLRKDLNTKMKHAGFQPTLSYGHQIMRLQSPDSPPKPPLSMHNLPPPASCSRICSFLPERTYSIFRRSNTPLLTGNNS